MAELMARLIEDVEEELDSDGYLPLYAFAWWLRGYRLGLSESEVMSFAKSSYEAFTSDRNVSLVWLTSDLDPREATWADQNTEPSFDHDPDPAPELPVLALMANEDIRTPLEELVVAASFDWLDVGFAYGLCRPATRLDPEATRHRTLRALRHGLDRGLLQMGDVTPNGFEVRGLDAHDAHELVRSAWMERDPVLGADTYELPWFAVTDAGERLAHEVLERETRGEPLRAPRNWYVDVTTADRGDLERAIATDQPETITEALLGVVLADDDWHWSQERCLELLDHPAEPVRSIAVICLGHIARRHSHIDRERVFPALERIRTEQPSLAGRVDDAIDDIDVFTTPGPRTSRRGSASPGDRPSEPPSCAGG